MRHNAVGECDFAGRHDSGIVSGTLPPITKYARFFAGQNELRALRIWIGAMKSCTCRSGGHGSYGALARSLRRTRAVARRFVRLADRHLGWGIQTGRYLLGTQGEAKTRCRRHSPEPGGMPHMRIRQHRSVARQDPWPILKTRIAARKRVRSIDFDRPTPNARDRTHFGHSGRDAVAGAGPAFGRTTRRRRAPLCATAARTDRDQAGCPSEVNRGSTYALKLLGREIER